MAHTFNISPETRAGTLHFLYRQFFVRPPPVSRQTADLTGKTAIITGSNSGLGLETARQLIDLGAKVILAVRDESKGSEACLQLSEGQTLLPGSITVWKLDLSSYDSIIEFVSRARNLESLDIAVLNAGVYNVHEAFSSTGYEEDIQINYLSNILLTILLLPVIKIKSIGPGPGRIILVTSDVAAWSKFEERKSDPLLPVFQKPAASWNMSERYGTSKLLGQLFLTELVRHISPTEVIVTCTNPRFCRRSNLGRQAQGTLYFAYQIMTGLIGRSCSVGARTIVHAAAVLQEEIHGQYVEDAKIQPYVSNQLPSLCLDVDIRFYRLPPLVYSKEGEIIRKRLYEETLTALSFAGLRDILQNKHPGTDMTQKSM
jgi:NAD(P)-dependent dehydrogenase (short-subunit alcohol dehydrogenase family)